MLKRFVTPMVIVFALIAMMIGCVAPPETEQAGAVDQAREDSLKEAERDSLLRLNRMFAYDKLRVKEWDAAKDFLWKVVKLDTEMEFNEWDRLYQTYQATGQIDSAQIVIQMGLENHPNDPFLNATHAFFLMKTGQNEEALKHYTIALENEQDNIEYMQKQAELYEKLNMGEEAISAYENLLAIQPDNITFKDKYTSLLREYRNPEEYIASLEQNVADNPEDMTKRTELLFAYVDQNMNEKVVEQATEIIKRNPSDTQAYNEKAKAQVNLNRLDDATETYKALLEVVPTDVNAMLSIADNERSLGRYTSARSWVLKAKAEEPDNARADFILGQVYETSADKCSAGRGIQYDDRLVFTVAYGLYLRAAGSDDWSIKDKANRRADYLTEFIPNYSHWFMNQTKKAPQASCYSWINSGWAEVSYIGRYLEKVAASK